VDDYQCILVARARGGDLAAFNDLVERFRRPMYTFAYTRLGSAEDAQDAVQEAFLDAYLGLDRLQECGKFAAWLTTIVARRCAGIIRARRRHDELNEQALVWEDRPLADTQFGHAWAMLSPTDRRVLLLSAVAGYSYAEVAAELRLSITAVRARIHRARKRLYQEVYPMSDAATVHLTREVMERLLSRLISAENPCTAAGLQQVADASQDAPVAAIARGLAWMMEHGESFERAFLLTRSLPMGVCTVLKIGREAGQSEMAFQAAIQMLKYDLLPPGATISRERLAECFAYISCLLQAGFPLFQSIEMAATHTPEAATALTDIITAWKSRASMAGALEKHSEVFSKPAVSILVFGEQTRRLDVVFSVLATFLWEPWFIDREKIAGDWSERLEWAKEKVIGG
jgi:RNA polymerase sigma-70 factor (ECF subfamily)